MSNQNGKNYGFTGLFPLTERAAAPALRTYLRAMAEHPRGSPLSLIPLIHMARLAIIDDLPYQGAPAKRDRLNSAYLLFACQFDGTDPAQLAAALKAHAPEVLHEIWGHCRGFPGVSADDGRLAAYFQRCQLATTLFLADKPHASAEDILQALLWRRRFTEFVAQHQGGDPLRLQAEFTAFWASLAREPAPAPGSL